MNDTRSLIDGESVDTVDGYENIDPADGRLIGMVSRGGADEVAHAVDAARRAQRSWMRTLPEERAAVMLRLAARMRSEADALAYIESADTGKPISQARNDVDVSVRYLEFYAHAIDSYYGITIPRAPDLLAYTVREPHGVYGSVLAWNYPLQLLCRAIAPALATGNACVIKPADETPRSAVRVAELALEVGLARGLLNVVTGIGSEAGAAVAAHPDVAHVGFVGSPAVGRLIAHAAAERLVPATLELGGKSAQLVFADADIDRALVHVTNGILQNAGQTCSAGSRLLVDEEIHEEFVTALADRFAKVRIGPGGEDPDLGPLISQKQLTRVAEMTERAAGDLVIGGRAAMGIAGDGCFFAPTIFDNVSPDSEIAQEEVFGPVLSVIPFRSEAEAVEVANSTDYALLGAVWTNDLSRAHRVAGAIEAGQVYVNTYGAGGGVEFPFGGSRKSGYGREKGREALDAHTRTKTIVIQL